MHSATRQSLKDFDNSREFERLAADMLNALGFSDVEPIAPGGGADGGKDIKFRDGDISGVAFVTLDKGIRDKFAFDLGKLDHGQGKIALFCNVDITPKNRLDFTKNAFDKGYLLDIYDLERIRSFFDSTLTEQRRRYLKIDDSVALSLRNEVRKLLKYPDSVPDNPVQATILESHSLDVLPRRLFELLINYDEAIIKEIPKIGPILHNHFASYYAFRVQLKSTEEDLITTCGTLSPSPFRQAWRILYRYCMLRSAEVSTDDIRRHGDFLNYGITWNSAEQVFESLRKDGKFGPLIQIGQEQAKLSANVQSLLKEL